MQRMDTRIAVISLAITCLIHQILLSMLNKFQVAILLTIATHLGFIARPFAKYSGIYQRLLNLTFRRTIADGFISALVSI